MGLYERLLEEREEEERGRGRPLGALRGLDSPVLDRLLTVARKRRPPGYAADMAMMRRLITRGVHSQGAAYRLHGFRSRYEGEHAELAAEAQGQEELL